MSPNATEAPRTKSEAIEAMGAYAASFLTKPGPHHWETLAEGLLNIAASYFAWAEDCPHQYGTRH